jgi:uncharacterized repeat protein (TIGR04076 family)
MPDSIFFLDPNQENKKNILNRLKPETLCPFAAHILYPYFFGFQKGSWFRWSKDKNSVIAQCPNPNGGVVFCITKHPSGSISAQITKLNGSCLAGHKQGDVFELAAADLTEPVKYDYCHLNQLDNLAINVISHSKLCRYYQKPGLNIMLENLAPASFCLPVYFAAYPTALSLLYDGNNFESLNQEKISIFDCPCEQNNVKIQVGTKKNIFSYFLNLLEKILRFLGWPKDVLDKSINFQAVSLASGCPKKLQPGQITEFNLHNARELCPAVFYTIFPFLPMLSDKIFPYWTKDKKETELDLQCPDAGAKIIYRLTIKKS